MNFIFPAFKNNNEIVYRECNAAGHSNTFFRKQTALAVLSLVACTTQITGCATTARDKSLQVIGGAAVLGGAYGATRPEFKSENAILYASAAAAIAGIYSLFHFDDSKEIERMKVEKQELEQKISVLETKLNPSLISEGNSLLSAPLPNDIAKLVKPGSWRRYRLDQWTQDETNPNIWYRQKEMFEFIPPQTGNQ